MAKVKHFVKQVRTEKDKNGRAIPVYRLIIAKPSERQSEIKMVKM